ncbi:hypothetical protein A2U01_0097749, partial [Trifolium medium]|nr:hypothetical protein [Trifolium medium]
MAITRTLALGRIRESITLGSPPRRGLMCCTQEYLMRILSSLLPS